MTGQRTLRTETGVGRLRELRRSQGAPDLPFVGVIIDTDSGPVSGVLDTRQSPFTEMFLVEGEVRVTPVALHFQKLDVAFRIDVCRSAAVDASIADHELLEAHLRRWVTVLRPATAADSRQLDIVDYVESQVARNGRNLTTMLRIALAGMSGLQKSKVSA
ncbi:MAG TPA: hypothetical protein VHC63_13495 [Acidimicrobiales bacterium]|nr:hypothetical protein [Acidimicrobiales bacterium]